MHARLSLVARICVVVRSIKASLVLYVDKERKLGVVMEELRHGGKTNL